MANVSVTADVLPQDPTSVQFVSGVYSILTSLSPPTPFQCSQPRDNRIFVLNMSPAAARAVLCEVHLVHALPA